MRLKSGQGIKEHRLSQRHMPSSYFQTVYLLSLVQTFTCILTLFHLSWHFLSILMLTERWRMKRKQDEGGGRWKLIFTSNILVHSFPDLGALYNKYGTTWLFTTYSSVLRSSTNDKCILTRVWNCSGSSLLSRSAKTLSLVVSIDFTDTIGFCALVIRRKHVRKTTYIYTWCWLHPKRK